MRVERERCEGELSAASRRQRSESGESVLTGAESLLLSLVGSGVDTCFANPGTSEMQFVDALDRVAGMRGVLCLFEGVATGAADGYARMTARPAATLLHLGPGLANGLANLHNARRAGSPIVNIVGDHATWHLQFDSPLSSDIEGFARPVSLFVRSARSVTEMGRDAAQAVAAARSGRGVSTLIAPADISWSGGGVVAEPITATAAPQIDGSRIDAAAAALRVARRPAILMGSRLLRRESLEIAGRLAAATGAQLYCEFFAPRLERGTGVVPVRRLPYLGQKVKEELAGIDLLLLFEVEPPVSFFAYPGRSSELWPARARVMRVARRLEDGTAALTALFEMIRADNPATRQLLARPQLPRGALTARSAGAVIAALLPENSIVVDESVTSGMAVEPLCQGAAPHDWLSHTGGALGLGSPMSVGAAIACPDRKTLCLLGDGSAMYTPQALWTQAREKLDITTIVFSNQSYAILNQELNRINAKPGPSALSTLALEHPQLRFADLASAMGVEGCRVDTAEAFASALRSALTTRGPRVIELTLAAAS
jgi:acetolactate synthase I/II/III large subunit